MHSPHDETASPFKATSWTLISRTREQGKVAREATASLCRFYWQPLYVYARRSAGSVHGAEDIVQGFLLHVVEHEVFAHADAERGRFRTFLLAALQQYMARLHRDDSRLKRAPTGGLVSLNVEAGERAVAQSSGEPTPDGAFDRAWAKAQLDMVWSEIEADFSAAGKSALFDHLRPFIGGGASGTAKQIATDLRMSEGAVNVAAHRLRRQFAETLRRQVASTLESPDEVDDELARLRSALAERAG